MRFSATQRSFTQRSAARVSVLMATLLLAACGSSVDLNSAAGAPVDDRTGGASAGASAGAAGGANLSSSAIDEATYNALIKVVYFDFDSAQVRSEFNAGLEAKAQYLQADRTRRVKLEGHTDERGGSEYNLALGQQRAEAVRRSLAVLGVSESQMEAVSYGKERLASTGTDETAHAANRRVELSR
ncbi:MAG: OmpA family protein [Hydrogenophaga sp.]|jgi:peptidoglycan-associated lipoprotein|nr:OmpA family protein [Hydrogenophaga sp.]